MTDTKLGDLDKHLFAQIDRLGDPNLKPEELDAEVQRSAAIVKIADQITQNARTKITAATLFAQHGNMIMPLIPQIGSSE